MFRIFFFCTNNNLYVFYSGSIDSEDVRKKFVSQKETKDRLTALKTTTETQKKELQLKCQQLNEEFEQCRFSDAQDKEQYVKLYKLIVYRRIGFLIVRFLRRTK